MKIIEWREKLSMDDGSKISKTLSYIFLKFTLISTLQDGFYYLHFIVDKIIVQKLRETVIWSSKSGIP